MFKVKNRNTRKRCEICLKLTLKTPERRQRQKTEHLCSGFNMILLEFIDTLLLNFFWLSLISSLVHYYKSKSSRQWCPVKKDVLNNFIPFTTSLASLFNEVADFIKKDSTQVFSCEIWKFFWNTYFEKHLLTAASVIHGFSFS